MTTEHTAGPWIAKELLSGGYVILHEDRSKSGLWHRRFDESGHFSAEDARLIAAAPELLRQLKALAVQLDEAGWGVPPNVKAVILAAEGGR